MVIIKGIFDASDYSPVLKNPFFMFYAIKALVNTHLFPSEHDLFGVSLIDLAPFFRAFDTASWIDDTDIVDAAHEL